MMIGKNENKTYSLLFYTTETELFSKKATITTKRIKKKRVSLFKMKKVCLISAKAAKEI